MAGYADLNDHDTLRDDVVFALAAGKQDSTGQSRERERDQGHALAASSTLNRLELTPKEADATHRYKKIVYAAGAMDQLLVEAFLDAHDEPPSQIVLDLDATTESRKVGEASGWTLQARALMRQGSEAATCSCSALQKA